MVQLLKYKSFIITDDMVPTINEFHSKMYRKDLAAKIGVNENTLKHYLNKMGYPRKRDVKFVKWEDKPTRLVISGVRQGDYTEAYLAAQKAVEQFKVKKRK